MKRAWSISVRVMALAAVFASLNASAATISWNTGSASWDNSTTANWSPTQVPTNSDTVYITNVVTPGIAVTFDSTLLVPPERLALLRVGNATAGKTNTLTIGAGKTLGMEGAVKCTRADFSICRPAGW